MMIKCRELMKLSSFKNIELVAGINGLDRNVSWPYVGQTESVAQWVHGGELLFITGMGRNIDDKSLVGLLKESIHKNLAGLVILIGNDYIKEVSCEIIDVANENDFPVFQMPWSIKLIDVTREISSFIMEKQFEERKGKDFLGKLLFSEEYTRENIYNIVKSYEISIKPKWFISIFNIGTKKIDVNYKYKNVMIDSDYVQETINSMCRENNVSVISLMHGDNIICLISEEECGASNDSGKYIKVVYKLLKEKYKILDIYLCIGRAYRDIYDMKKSYEEAINGLRLQIRGSIKEDIIEYSNLGIYRLLFEVENIDEIKKYYNEVLGNLLEYDRKNDTNLIDTLKAYLFNNCNLIKTSQNVFIHRNTLVYRLNKIKNILNIDLDSSMCRVELMNCIMIANYLKSQE
ncbi:MAG: PucR family transcriptional regulator ligand-binding domain-containing protein [Clostridium sp.]|uniref:PucR family transcriptional regulator n=1 Tax=Clostridium sp. TaxID=1506 RepID=UPI00306FAD78